MPRYLPQDYRAWLTHGDTYRFVLCDNSKRGQQEELPGRAERVVTVTARRSEAGAIWLIYEHRDGTLELRWWIMPNGGLAEAREMGPGQAVLLRVLPSVANVRDLEEPGAELATPRSDGDDAAELSADMRRQLNDLLDHIDWGDKP